MLLHARSVVCLQVNAAAWEKHCSMLAQWPAFNFFFWVTLYIFLRTGHINYQRSIIYVRVLESVSRGLGFFNKRNAHNIDTRFKRALPGARNSQSLSVVITLWTLTLCIWFKSDISQFHFLAAKLPSRLADESSSIPPACLICPTNSSPSGIGSASEASEQHC